MPTPSEGPHIEQAAAGPKAIAPTELERLDESPDDRPGGPARVHKVVTEGALSTQGADFRDLALEFARIAEIVSTHWNVGRVIGIEKITRGVANESYFVDVDGLGGKERLFLRMYAPAKKEWWLQLEHDVLQHLSRHRFEITPKLIATRDGSTYATSSDRQGRQRYVMLTSLLSGDDKYAHEKNDLPESELESVGRIFARYHNIVSMLNSPRFRPDMEPTEARMLRKLRRRVEEVPALIEEIKRGGDFAVGRVAAEVWPKIEGILTSIPSALTPSRYIGLPHLPVHHDLHPGNMLFAHGEVSGLFDFDFVKVDARAYDVGLAAVFFGTRWVDDPSIDGRVDSERFERLIRAYQHPDNIVLHEGLSHLSNAEIDVLPEMMQIGNAILVYWFINDFAQRLKSGDSASAQALDAEYARCLRHRMATTAFIHADRASLKAIAYRCRDLNEPA